MTTIFHKIYTERQIKRHQKAKAHLKTHQIGKQTFDMERKNKTPVSEQYYIDFSYAKLTGGLDKHVTIETTFN